MATKKQFEQRCKELNVTIDDNGFCLTIDAPKGMIFSGYGNHSESIQYYPHTGWTREELYDEMIHLMNMGVEPCDDPNCDICNE